MATIYGDTNAKVSHNRIKWNIEATTEVPTSATPGQIGDILIVTSSAELVKKIKYVATKALTDADLQNNSINVYEDFTKDRVLVNRNNGFNMYIWASQQNIMVDNAIMIANVFFYDGITNSWKQYNIAYKDAINLKSFTGQNLATILNEIWGGTTYTDILANEGHLIPPLHDVEANDAFIYANFTGCDLNVDNLWAGFSFADEATATAYIPN